MSVTSPAPHLAAPAHVAFARSAVVLSGALAMMPMMLAASAPSSFDLPADVAERSLREFSRQSGSEVVFASGITKDVRTRPVKGEMTPRHALDAMLKDTGPVAFEDKSGAFSSDVPPATACHRRTFARPVTPQKRRTPRLLTTRNR